MKPSKLLPYKCLKLACCYVRDDKKNSGPGETEVIFVRKLVNIYIEINIICKFG